MSLRIDEELEKVSKAGQTPKEIYIGADLYEELYSEVNPVYAAALVGSNDNDKAPVYTPEEVTEYKGFPIVKLDGVSADYLKIST